MYLDAVPAEVHKGYGTRSRRARKECEQAEDGKNKRSFCSQFHANTS